MAIRTEDVAGLDFSEVAGPERIGPVTPGDVLRADVMAPLGLSARALARALGVRSNRVTAIRRPQGRDGQDGDSAGRTVQRLRGVLAEPSDDA